MPIILDGISKSYAGKQALRRVSAELPDRGITLVSGPSGSGKTTLVRIVAGLERPDSGAVLGVEGRRISMVFQEDRLLYGGFTALENVALVSDETTAARWLDALELRDEKNKKTDQLSGGMRRRAALARALAYGGDILLLDEPFKGLDAPLRDRIMPHIVDAARSAAVVLVTHDDVELEPDCRIEL